LNENTGDFKLKDTTIRNKDSYGGMCREKAVWNAYTGKELVESIMGA